MNICKFYDILINHNIISFFISFSLTVEIFFNKWYCLIYIDIFDILQFFT